MQSFQNDQFARCVHSPKSCVRRGSFTAMGRDPSAACEPCGSDHWCERIRCFRRGSGGAGTRPSRAVPRHRVVGRTRWQVGGGWGRVAARRRRPCGVWAAGISCLSAVTGLCFSDTCSPRLCGVYLPEHFAAAAAGTCSCTQQRRAVCQPGSAAGLHVSTLARSHHDTIPAFAARFHWARARRRWRAGAARRATALARQGRI